MLKIKIDQMKNKLTDEKYVGIFKNSYNKKH